ncbi:hypothetical protein [Rhizobium mesoamericanum]|uniref:hypothetical protein n=1 Tax=Rhizobium mesoamericanum TaxID=1079800 RepID=UPI000408E78D|nr:hypothetical protein [Rhizobium mesoamericanum]
MVERIPLAIRAVGRLYRFDAQEKLEYSHDVPRFLPEWRTKYLLNTARLLRPSGHVSIEIAIIAV